MKIKTDYTETLLAYEKHKADEEIILGYWKSGDWNELGLSLIDYNYEKLHIEFNVIDKEKFLFVAIKYDLVFEVVGNE